MVWQLRKKNLNTAQVSETFLCTVTHSYLRICCFLHIISCQYRLSFGKPHYFSLYRFIIIKQFPIDRHLNYYYIFAIAKNNTVNILIHLSQGPLYFYSLDSWNQTFWVKGIMYFKLNYTARLPSKLMFFSRLYFFFCDLQVVFFSCLFIDLWELLVWQGCISFILPMLYIHIFSQNCLSFVFVYTFHHLFVI